jgi:hypothetical protein
MCRGTVADKAEDTGLANAYSLETGAQIPWKPAWRRWPTANFSTFHDVYFIRKERAAV